MYIFLILKWFSGCGDEIWGVNMWNVLIKGYCFKNNNFFICIRSKLKNRKGFLCIYY